MNGAEQFLDDLRLLEAPQPWHIHWWIIAGALLFAAILWWFIRRRRAVRAQRNQIAETRHAHEDALAELARLFAMITAEQSRPYAIASSTIVRRYIERRFALHAPRRSTEEFLKEARVSSKLELDHQELLGELLRQCDLIKFALGCAGRSELEKLHESAVRFVNETRVQRATAVAA
jgi:hypothetical protein